MFLKTDQAVLKYVVSNKNVPLSGFLVKQLALKFAIRWTSQVSSKQRLALINSKKGIVGNDISGESAKVNEAN